MKKRIIAIGRKSKTFDKLIVDPGYCPHENTGWQIVGGWFTTRGEADDDIREVFYCLDCGSELDPPEHESGEIDDDDYLPQFLR